MRHPVYKSSTKTSSNYREELIERYYAYQKDKRELKRRNLQAQTNIAQFFRKHKLNPYPGEAQRTQTAVRDEYDRLLHKIELLANEKDAEGKRFDASMEEIFDETKRLQAG